MSNDTCNDCGLKYQAMRTGHTYQDIYTMLWSGSDEPRTWRYKGRSAVLGYWHQIKKEIWEYHLEMCEQEKAAA